MSALERLQTWYASQCDGEWEHASGIVIQTCYNPGWRAKVSLGGTPLQNRAFAEAAEGVDAAGFADGPRWIHCRAEGTTWHGAGDETTLERILETFLAWADDHAG